MPVLLQNRQRTVAVNCAWLERTAEAVLVAVRASSAELSLALVSDQRMRSLNRRYRKKDWTTDVLAFPMYEESPLTFVLSLKGRGKEKKVLLGDVVISMPTAKRQAAALGQSLRDELTRLLIHGVLHLLGYDHERSERDAFLMARKEQAVLRAIRGKEN